MIVTMSDNSSAILDNISDNDSNYDSDNSSAILDNISDMIVTMIVTTVVLY